MICSLCKHPIKGDERYIIEHYSCSAGLHGSFRDEIVELRTRYNDALTELAKHLDPNNQNVKEGDVLACIRDLAQVAMGRQGEIESLVDLLRDIYNDPDHAVEHAERVVAVLQEYKK